MPTGLEDRTALVTGAGRGIGRAIAIGLADRGARVRLLARTRSDLDEVFTEIRDAGGVATVLAADVSDAEQSSRPLERLLSEFGPASDHPAAGMSADPPRQATLHAR